MNYQASDYLANLNLDFDPNVSPEENANDLDLDLFSQTEFFDLDVFLSDFVPETKQLQQDNAGVQQQQLHHNQQQGVAPQVKQEVFEPNFHVEKSEFQDFTVATPELGESKQAELGEIKRKRNTAASARFRIKKKLKEKQMEQQARDLQEKLTALEKKMKLLEMENKCLKQLILQKNEEKNCDLLESIKKRSLGESGFTFTN